MTKSQPMQEGLSHGRKVEMGSERSFGLVFTAVFALICLAPLKSGGEPRLWAGGIGAVFFAVALLRPALLKPLNRVWFLIGMALHHVVTPVVMGLLFFLTVTPMALLMRLCGKDPLRLKRDPAATSYWILRQPPGPAPESMSRQF
jgi:hypothetical protein